VAREKCSTFEERIKFIQNLSWIIISEDLRVYEKMILKCIWTKKTGIGVKHGMDPSGSG